jgi:hypothetical protein
VAGTVAQLMIDMRSSQPGDLVRHADVLERLMERLPPPRAQNFVSTSTDGLSLAQLGVLYGRMIGDPTCNIGDPPMVDITTMEPMPQAPVDAPEPSIPTQPRPEPETAPAEPPPKAASRSVPGLTEPVESPAPVVELPPDPRLRAFGRVVNLGAG